MTSEAPRDLAKEFETHRPRLWRIVQGRLDPALRARTDPDDVLAAVYLKAHERWAAYLQERRPEVFVWLYRFAEDCIIEAWRRESAQGRDYRRDEPYPEQPTVQLAMGLIAGGTGPSSAAARKELFDLVRQTMELLRPDEREILLKRYFDDLTFKEAADYFDVSENTATQRCLRALRRLQKLWRQRHGDLGLEG